MAFISREEPEEGRLTLWEVQSVDRRLPADS